MTDRYQQIEFIIDYIKPNSIVEIGTWNGARAIAMAEVALKQVNRLHYWGFDLFEESSDQTDAEELNVKQSHTEDAVAKKLASFQKNHTGFTFDLIKGNTRTTLAGATDAIVNADLAYIDGGHSVETIAGDYEALKTCNTVLFDDYYVPDENGDCPDTTKFGCNQLVKTMPHWVLPVADGIVSGGLVKMVLTGELAQEFIEQS